MALTVARDEPAAPVVLVAVPHATPPPVEYEWQHLHDSAAYEWATYLAANVRGARLFWSRRHRDTRWREGVDENRAPARGRTEFRRALAKAVLELAPSATVVLEVHSFPPQNARHDFEIYLLEPEEPECGASHFAVTRAIAFTSALRRAGVRAGVLRGICQNDIMAEMRVALRARSYLIEFSEAPGMRPGSSGGDVGRTVLAAIPELFA